MAVEKHQGTAPLDSNPRSGKCSNSDDRALAEFQASTTALALIEAFARVAAHRAVADAKSIARGEKQPN